MSRHAQHDAEEFDMERASQEGVDYIPDWARPMSEAELYREAMDYEENARYDRYDGLREEMADWNGDFEDPSEAQPYTPPYTPPVAAHDHEVPF